MENDTASRSAAIIAAHRAIESDKTPEDRICFDPYARAFLPPRFTVIGPHPMPEQDALDAFKQVVPGFHEFFLARTRYIDDFLQKAVADGLEQLVILGAGYDSRAYRFTQLRNTVRVFEIDHPATQKSKKAKLAEIFESIPDYVTYIPADFFNTSLESCLYENGFEKNLHTLFILEGVSMYVSREIMDKILKFIVETTAKKSSVIFDYTYPEVIAGQHERKEAKEWLKRTQSSDEPLLFGIKKDQIHQYLSERSFRNINNVTSDYFNSRYFIGVNKGKEATPILSIAHAEANNQI